MLLMVARDKWVSCTSQISRNETIEKNAEARLLTTEIIKITLNLSKFIEGFAKG